MTVEGGSTYQQENALKQLWRWLTRNGTVNADATSPSLSTTPAATTGTATDSTDVTVDATAGGVTVLAANTNRKAAIFVNTGTADIRIGASVTTTKGVLLKPGGSLVYGQPFCPTVEIKAIRVGSVSSTVSVEEIT